MWRKGYSVILLSLYLLGVFHPGELAKLPHFYRHFQFHQRQDRMNLWAFVYHHYGNGNHKELADYDEDMKLPFKIPQNCIFLTGFFVSHPKAYKPSGIGEFYPEPLALSANKKKNSGFLDSIWQPPRPSFS